MSSSDKNELKFCDSGATAWASLIIATISINVSWWLFEIPALWQHGWRAYSRAVSWQCLRVNFPVAAGIYAIRHAEPGIDPAMVYYTGLNDIHERKRMTRFEVIKSFVMDSLTIIGTAISIHKVTQYKLDDQGDLPLSEWSNASSMFPTLPVAITGLWLLWVTRVGLCGSGWWLVFASFLSLFLSLFLTGLTIILVLYYHTLLRIGNIWMAVMFAYFAIGIPWILLAPERNILYSLFFTAYAVYGRVGGIIGATGSNARVSPFCKASTGVKVFGWIYLAMGIVAGVIALWARYRYRVVRKHSSTTGTRRTTNSNRHDHGSEASSPSAAHQWIGKKHSQQQTETVELVRNEETDHLASPLARSYQPPEEVFQYPAPSHKVPRKPVPVRAGHYQQLPV